MESKTDLVTANLLSPPKITPGRVPLSALSPSPINPNVALRDDWLREAEDQSEFLKKFGKRLPEAIRAQHQALQQRLSPVTVSAMRAT